MGNIHYDENGKFISADILIPAHNENEQQQNNGQIEFGPVEDDSEEVYDSDDESEFKDLTKELEDLSKDDVKVDLSTVELDGKGVPVLNAKDLETLILLSGFAGLDKNNTLDEIKMMQDFVKKYRFYKEKESQLIDENKTEELENLREDPDFIISTDKETYEKAIDTLATYQKSAREEDILEMTSGEMRIVYSHSMAFMVYITALYKHYMKDPNDTIFDFNKSIKEILSDDNYYSILVKSLNHKFEKLDLKKEMSEIFTFDYKERIDLKYRIFFKRLFNSIAKKYYYRACNFTINQMTYLTGSTVDYFFNIMYLAITEDFNIAKAYYSVTKYPNVYTDEEIKKEMEARTRELSESPFYNELKHYSNSQEIIDLATSFATRLLALPYKLASLKSDSNIIKNLIKLSLVLIKNIDEKLNNIYKKYDITGDIVKKEKNENGEEKDIVITRLTQLEKYFQEEIRKVDYSEKQLKELDKQAEKMKLIQERIKNGENISPDDIEVEKEIPTDEEEIEQMREQVVQFERDKFSADNYPNYELAKRLEQEKSNIVHYIGNPNNLKYCNLFLINFMTQCIHYNTLDVLSKILYDDLGTKFFVNKVIPYDIPLKDFDHKVIENGYSTDPFDFNYSSDVINNIITDINQCVHVVENAKDTDEMVDEMYDYYKTNKDVPVERKIAAVTYMYEKENVGAIRYSIFMKSIEIYNVLLDLVENLFDEELISKITSLVDKKEAMVIERENKLKAKRSRKLKKRHSK